MSPAPSPVSRRHFLRVAGAASLTSPFLIAQSPPAAAMPALSCNTYPWMTFLQRAGRDFETELAAVAAAIAATGYTDIEPILDDHTTIETYGDLLAATGLKMTSAYMNSTLHEAAEAARNIDHVVAVATAAKNRFGTRILVTNPSPIRWGGPENKTDDQIKVQGRALEQLGAALRAEGVTLAYHNHDSELRLGAREFHHMLASTDPANVKFCLDAHWVFRGSGDSNVALFDVLELYGDRIVELHLRQSTAGRWSETFSASGDIDYGRLFQWLKDRRITPWLTMEQAVEDGSPLKHDAVSAHRASHGALTKMLTAGE